MDTNHDDNFHALDMANNHDSDAYKWKGIVISCQSTPLLLSIQPMMFTADQKWTVALLKLLDDINPPDCAFSKILRWAHNA